MCVHNTTNLLMEYEKENAKAKKKSSEIPLKIYYIILFCYKISVKVKKKNHLTCIQFSFCLFIQRKENYIV